MEASDQKKKKHVKIQTSDSLFLYFHKFHFSTFNWYNNFHRTHTIYYVTIKLPIKDMVTREVRSTMENKNKQKPCCGRAFGEGQKESVEHTTSPLY